MAAHKMSSAEAITELKITFLISSVHISTHIFNAPNATKNQLSSDRRLKTRIPNAIDILKRLKRPPISQKMHSRQKDLTLWKTCSLIRQNMRCLPPIGISSELIGYRIAFSSLSRLRVHYRLLLRRFHPFLSQLKITI